MQPSAGGSPERCENDETRHHGGPFCLTLLRKVALPSTLRVLGSRTFSNCELLERVEFRGENSLARIGCYCFANTLLEEIALPSTVREMEEDALGECSCLRTVWVGDGFALNLARHVSDSVQVLPARNILV